MNRVKGVNAGEVVEPCQAFTVSEAYAEFKRGPKAGPGLALDHYREKPEDQERLRRVVRAILFARGKSCDGWGEEEWELHEGIVHTAIERFVTRQVIGLIAELYPLEEKDDGRIVVPEDATPELAARIRSYEPELLWASGCESGEVYGRSPVPAVPPPPPGIYIDVREDEGEAPWMGNGE